MTYNGTFTRTNLTGHFGRDDTESERLPAYTGPTSVYSNTEETQTLATANKSVYEDITVLPNRQLQEPISGGLAVSII